MGKRPRIRALASCSLCCAPTPGGFQFQEALPHHACPRPLLSTPSKPPLGWCQPSALQPPAPKALAPSIPRITTSTDTLASLLPESPSILGTDPFFPGLHIWGLSRVLRAQDLESLPSTLIVGRGSQLVAPMGEGN